MSTYPRLAHLAGAYFHQDYDLDAPTPAGIITSFLDGEEPATAAELAGEIASILGSDMTETQIDALWVTELHAYYEPARDALTYRAWLTTLLSALQRH
jgi:hypothetical protein